VATREQNEESLKNALATLNSVASDPMAPKAVKRGVTEVVSGLKGGEGSLAVRAANAISALDDITQDPNMPSHIRTRMWQAVSTLEGIREKA